MTCPPPPAHPPACRPSRGPGAGARAILALLAVAVGSPAAAAEPLSGWLDGLGESAAALAAGDGARALTQAQRAWEALPAGPAGALASAAVGLARLRLGASDQAIDPLRAAVVGGAPESLPVLRLALGEALLGAGRPLEAIPVLEQAAAGPATRLARRARWLEGRALLAAGHLPQAVARLEPLLLEAPEDVEAAPGRLELAGAQRQLGRAGRALALYRALALEEPDRPEGAAALEALARWQEAGGPVPPMSGADRLARAERLLARGHPAEALAEVDLAGAARPPAARPRAALQRALVLLAQGRHAEAEALAAPLAATGPGADLRRGATWVLARAAARTGRLAEAARAYAQVAATPGGLPGLPEARWRDLADEAAFLAAWLWYDAGELRRAVGALEAFARLHPASRRVDDARWFAAWARVRLGERGEARRALTRLETGPLADAALYWQGRLAQGPAAAALYRRAQATAPDGWYAALARARLESLGPAAAPAVAPGPPGEPGPLSPLVSEAGPGHRRLGAAAGLLALGWRDAARSELEDLLRRRPSAAVAAQLGELASFAGEVDLPFRAARDLLGPTRRTARWLHPEPLPALAWLAGAAGVDPDLLRAVVRKESGFRPGARSAAGALGLTQLLPATAARLAALAGSGVDPTPGLADPEANVALGAHYLGLLQDRFGGEAAALAAYNAGPGPAAGWARARAGLPLDEWVEAIPYKETRGYVKAVLADREVYRRLAGLPPGLDAARPIEAPGPGAAF
jgi:soluble lytic murein transglycosylase